MTVRELIQRLITMDPDREVVIGRYQPRYAPDRDFDSVGKRVYAIKLDVHGFWRDCVMIEIETIPERIIDRDA